MTETSAPLYAVGSLTTGQPVAAGVVQLATATVLNIALEILSKKARSLLFLLCSIVFFFEEGGG